MTIGSVLNRIQYNKLIIIFVIVKFMYIFCIDLHFIFQLKSLNNKLFFQTIVYKKVYLNVNKKVIYFSLSQWSLFAIDEYFNTNFKTMVKLIVYTN